MILTADLTGPTAGVSAAARARHAIHERAARRHLAGPVSAVRRVALAALAAEAAVGRIVLEVHAPGAAARPPHHARERTRGAAAARARGAAAAAVASAARHAASARHAATARASRDPAAAARSCVAGGAGRAGYAARSRATARSRACGSGAGGAGRSARPGRAGHAASAASAAPTGATPRRRTSRRVSAGTGVAAAAATGDRQAQHRRPQQCPRSLQHDRPRAGCLTAYRTLSRSRAEAARRVARRSAPPAPPSGAPRVADPQAAAEKARKSAVSIRIHSPPTLSITRARANREISSSRRCGGRLASRIHCPGRLRILTPPIAAHADPSSSLTMGDRLSSPLSPAEPATNRRRNNPLQTGCRDGPSTISC